jgi:hypothetical protein
MTVVRAKIRFFKLLNAVFMSVIFAFMFGAGSASANTSLMPVYRLYNSASGQHLLTIDENEYTTLQTSTFEAYPLDNGSCDGGLIPVYRLVNGYDGQHFLTADSSEATFLTENYNTDHWYSEGVGFCDYSTQVAGSIPVYRLYNSVSGEHFLTADTNEANTLNGTHNWFIETLDNGGIAFYAKP